MASSLVVVVQTNLSQTDLKHKVEMGADRPRESAQSLERFFRSLSGGIHRSKIDVHTAAAAPVAASQTITLASVSANDTVTLGGVVFTAKASPTLESEFSQAGTDTQDAASLAAKISAHSTIGQVFVATSALGVVTVSTRQKGVFGNFIALAESTSASRITVGGAALAGGTGGSTEAAQSYVLGL